MANITNIFGTDSVSSSRIVLNSNFKSIKDELDDISNLLDFENETLTLTGSIKGGALDILPTGGSVSAFKVTDTEVVTNVPAEFNFDVTLNGSLKHSVSSGVTSLPSGVNMYDKTTYILDAAPPITNLILSDAEDGQEITLIANAGSITFDVNNIIGATSIVLNDGGSITLRFVDETSTFYIICSNNASISQL